MAVNKNNKIKMGVDISCGQSYEREILRDEQKEI